MVARITGLNKLMPPIILARSVGLLGLNLGLVMSIGLTGFAIIYAIFFLNVLGSRGCAPHPAERHTVSPKPSSGIFLHTAASTNSLRPLMQGEPPSEILATDQGACYQSEPCVSNNEPAATLCPTRFSHVLPKPSSTNMH